MSQAPIARLRGLSLCYPPPAPGEGAVRVLDRLDLEVWTGERVLILGASGSGKSSLCHVLAGLAPRLTGGELRGSVEVAGRDPAAVGSAELARLVQLVFQTAETSLFNMLVREEVRFSLEVAGRDRPGAAEEILARVGLAGFGDRPVGGLSGGEKTRLAFACALAPAPRLLLVDEALTDVDPEGRGRLLELLRRAAREGAAVVVCESESEGFQDFDRVLLLAGGGIVAGGPPSALLAQPELLRRHGLRPPQLAEVGARMGLGFWEMEEAVAALRGLRRGG